MNDMIPENLQDFGLQELRIRDLAERLLTSGEVDVVLGFRDDQEGGSRPDVCKAS